MSSNLMPPSLRPAGVRESEGRESNEGERKPPVGTRLGIPFSGAVATIKLNN